MFMRKLLGASLALFLFGAVAEAKTPKYPKAKSYGARKTKVKHHKQKKVKIKKIKHY